jgi:hypothetical protein
MKTPRFLVALVPLSLLVGCGDDPGTGGNGGAGGDGGAGGEGGGATVDACANVDELRATCQDLPESFDTSTTLAQGCYRANTSPVLGANVTLTLAPGVTILFAEGAGLETDATQAIVAAGSPELPICLTGDVAQPGSWDGVKLGRTEGDDHRFEHVVIEYGGSTDADAENAGLKVVSDSREVRLGLTNTTIRDSEGYGLYLVGSATLSAFSDNVLTANGLGPASVDSEVAGVLDATSTYVGNVVDEVLVRSYALSKNLAWAAIDVPYHLDASLSVEGDWTLAAPNTIVMSEGAAITVSGDAASLQAVGTAEAPIVFTGADKTRGHWDRLAFDNTNGDNQLAFVTVEYAGSTGSDANGAGIKAVADSAGLTLALSNVTVRESEGFGLWLTGSATVPVFSSNVFTANGLGPVSISSRRVHVLDVASSYDGNDVDRVRVRDDRVTEAVTWPDLGMPYQLEENVHVDLVWTLAPGVTLMMPESSWISVDGDLAGFHAVGTAADPITITGVEATPGYWHGILFDTSLNAANAIQHAVVEYGGSTSGGGEAGMINAASDSHGVVVSVKDSVVRHSGQWGIWLGGFSQYNGDIESSNTFTGNVAGDVYFAD